MVGVNKWQRDFIIRLFLAVLFVFTALNFIEHKAEWDHPYPDRLLKI